MNNSEAAKRARGTRWCILGFWLLVAGAVVLVIGLAGGPLGFVPQIKSFMLFGVGLLIVAAAALLTAVGIAISMGTAGDASALRSWGTLAVSVILIGTVLSQRPDTTNVPPIHDITTDTVNPPRFEAILALRADAPNPPEYAGGEVARQQQQAYPDITTLTIQSPPDEVFAAAEQVARDLGWDIVAADRAAGRIEATDTTTWFRFKDDVVVRLTARDTGTDVDVRSESRVGRSDMGANAARIRIFLQQLKARVTG